MVPYLVQLPAVPHRRTNVSMNSMHGERHLAGTSTSSFSSNGIVPQISKTSRPTRTAANDFGGALANIYNYNLTGANLFAQLVRSQLARAGSKPPLSASIPPAHASPLVNEIVRLYMMASITSSSFPSASTTHSTARRATTSSAPSNQSPESQATSFSVTTSSSARPNASSDCSPTSPFEVDTPYLSAASRMPSRVKRRHEESGSGIPSEKRVKSDSVSLWRPYDST